MKPLKAQIWNKSWWISETDPESLKTIYRDRLNKAHFDIIDEIEHYFEPQGYTKLFLLAESHLAIHTFPEDWKTYIELSSCVKRQFDNFLTLEKLWIDNTTYP